MPDLSDLFTPSELTAYRRLPRSLRMLTENALRNGYQEDAAAILLPEPPAVIRVTPTRLVMQDLLAVPLLADLASLRTELAARGANPNSINPRLPTDLVIDHSMTVVHYGTAQARRLNEEREIEINRERFTFLRWCADAFENLRIIPPGNGIVHQINLEQLATCVVCRFRGRSRTALSRTGNRQRQPHADDQRPRNSRLGRRRPGGRSRAARPAAGNRDA